MLTCHRCRESLDTLLEPSGPSANCPKCSQIYLSVGKLMSRSDTRLIQGVWEAFLKLGGKGCGLLCPKCARPMTEFQFTHRSQPMSFCGCRECYLLAMDQATLAQFVETHQYGSGNRSWEKIYRAPAHPFSWVLRTFHFLRSILETPIGNIRIGTLVGFFALVAGFTHWLTFQNSVVAFILGVLLVPVLRFSLSSPVPIEASRHVPLPNARTRLGHPACRRIES